MGKEAEIVAILPPQDTGSYVPQSNRDTFAPQRSLRAPFVCAKGTGGVDRQHCCGEKEPQGRAQERSSRPQAPEHDPITNLNV